MHPNPLDPGRKRVSLWINLSLLGLALLLGMYALYLAYRGKPAPPIEPPLSEQTPPIALPALEHLDRLDAAEIPPEERLPGQPPEVVAILGSQRLRHGGRTDHVCLSPDGRWIASVGTDDLIHLWDAVTLRELAAFQASLGILNCMTFSPDSKRLATSGSVPDLLAL